MLSREEVFRCFWLMCVSLADLVYLSNRSQAGEYRCEWRRHSLVILCQHGNQCEISVQRRKEAAFCVVNPGKINIWQGRMIMTAQGQPGIVHDGTIFSPASAANLLFDSIITHTMQNRVELAKAAGQS